MSANHFIEVKNNFIMPASLSPREIEILSLISRGYTTGEIANRLFVSVETVKTHRRHLLEKFNARNMAGLVRRAFEYGVFSCPMVKVNLN